MKNWYSVNDILREKGVQGLLLADINTPSEFSGSDEFWTEDPCEMCGCDIQPGSKDGLCTSCREEADLALAPEEIF